MDSIYGYKILKKIGVGLYTEVFKVKKNNDTLILKVIKPLLSSEDTLRVLLKQNNRLQHLNHPGIIKPLSIEGKNGAILVVQELFDGISLGDWLELQKKVFLSDFFLIACSITRILNDIHEAGYIHGGIKPNNILINPKTLDVRIIDLIRITRNNETSYYIYNDNFRRHSLSYISPEQTIRMNKKNDYRIDLYSLGIIFYELLSGKLPFYHSDPLEIIHFHLAQLPQPLNEIKPEVPEIIGEIVSKLTQKEPEKRYQTGAGLLFDLLFCQSQYMQKGDIRYFVLGQNDFAKSINMSSAMVGRNREKNLLLKEHKKSCSGYFKAALISGAPGIGKTRLVQELQLPIISTRSYFISGKFDQYREEAPYGTFIEAFRNFCRKILSEDVERIMHWNKKINEALNPNAKLITDLIPELGLIIGVQKEPASLPPREARSRFNSTVEKFIASIAKKDHPLTVFIDDLQWCDTASYEIIDNLFANAKDHPYLFLIGAYRDSEVSESHPLSNIIKKNSTSILRLNLERLNKHNINKIISLSLDTSLSKTTTLAEIIGKTSEGNPLYINESLAWLYKDKLLIMEKNGQWDWDDKKIKESKIPETIFGLFEEKIKKLPEKSLELAQIAALLGSSFKTDDLVSVSGKDHLILYNEISPLFNSGILVRGQNDINFFHDRVQEAVLKTVDRDKRPIIHKLIADILIKQIPEGTDIQTLDNLFEITEHLNKGQKDFSDKKSLYKDVEFNYHAGKKALASLAVKSGNTYFKQAQKLLAENSWNNDYNFTFLLYKNLAISELMLGNQDKSEKLFEILLEKSKTDSDKAECMAEQATNLLSMGRFKHSIETANQGLKYFGRKIPDDEAIIEKKIEEYDRLIKGFNITPKNIFNKKFLYDRKKVIELSLYNQLIPDYYLTGRVKQFYLVGLQSTYLCGFTEKTDLCIYPISIYMVYLCSIEDFGRAFIFEDLVMRLCYKFPDTLGETRGLNALVWTSLHLRKNLDDVFLFCIKTIESGKRSGDIYHAGLGYCAAFWTAAMHGLNLKIIENYVEECLDYSNKNNLSFSTEMAISMQAAWVEPMKKSDLPDSIEIHIKKWKKSGDQALLGNYYIFSGIAKYYIGMYREADFDLKKGKEYLPGHTSNIPNRMWHIFFVLNRLRMLDKESGENRINSVISAIQPVIDLIERWSELGPAILPYLALIKAEIKRVLRTFNDARNLYMDAIDIAGENKYILLEGQIHEYLGELFIEHSNKQGGYHIHEAAELYQTCNAQRKLQFLKENHRQYFTDKDKIISVPNNMPDNMPDNIIDDTYIFKAALAMAQELDSNELLNIMGKYIIKRAGAAEGYFFIEKNGELFCSVSGIKEDKVVINIKEIPFSDIKGFSKAIVRYVFRTKETVITSDALKEGFFTIDKDVQELKIRSVLCVPIIRRHKILGVVYLQNNLIKSVFGKEHVKSIRRLLIYASVALENSILYEKLKYTNVGLKEQVARRTRELEKTNLEFKDFTYSVFHDLRAPLRAINGFSNIINRRYRSDLNDEAGHYFDNIIQASEHMGHLIDDLMSFFTIGRQTVKRKHVNLNKIFTEAVNNVNDLITKKNGSIIIQDNLPVLWSDYFLLSQIFVNLLENALIYQKPGIIPEIKITGMVDQNKTRIFVADNGIGIAPEFHAKIFNIFQRLHNPDEYPGTGIGLSIVKKIVELLEGRINVKSAPGEGSTFILEFPTVANQISARTPIKRQI